MRRPVGVLTRARDRDKGPAVGDREIWLSGLSPRSPIKVHKGDFAAALGDFATARQRLLAASPASPVWQQLRSLRAEASSWRFGGRRLLHPNFYRRRHERPAHGGRRAIERPQPNARRAS
jgi:hypothetical protein